MKKWSDIEFLIVLHLYFISPRNISRNDDKLVEICDRLECYTGNVRTPDSIYLRLMNYRFCDPQERGKGMKGGYNQCIYYWNEYVNKIDELKKIYDKFIEDTNNYKDYKNMLQLRNDFHKFEAEIFKDLNDMDPERKDAYVDSMMKIRNSSFQKFFKHNLRLEFNNKCAICGLNDFGILIASHILEYSKCVYKYDMINCNNGLLLCPNHDALFDKHLISFENNGKIIINKNISKKMYNLLGINENFYLSSVYLNEERLKYLKLHKEIFEILNK